MKEVRITYVDGKWVANAEPAVDLSDQIVLFRNDDPEHACQITFQKSKAFGILGLALPPQSAFALTFRGVLTRFQLNDAITVARIHPDQHTENPCVPPCPRARAGRDRMEASA